MLVVLPPECYRYLSLLRLVLLIKPSKTIRQRNETTFNFRYSTSYAFPIRKCYLFVI